MAKIRNISEIQPTLGFTEFDILEKYRKSFHESELGRLHSVFPFERIAKESGLSEQRLGRKNIFSLCAKIGLMVSPTGSWWHIFGLDQCNRRLPISALSVGISSMLIGAIPAC